MFAELGFDVLKAERLVNSFLRIACHPPVVADAEQTVFVQLQVALNRPVAQDDVVRLGAGEVLHRRAAAFRRNESQVGLVAARQTDAALRVAMAQHSFNPGRLEKRAHQGRRAFRGHVGAHCENIDVSTRLAPAAQAADRHELDVGRALAKVPRELCGNRDAIGQQVPAGVLLSLVERFEDERFLLRTHAAQLAQAPFPCRRSEIVQRADVESRVEECHRLGPDALEPKQVEDRRRKLEQEILMESARPAVGKLTDLLGEVLADAGQLEELSLVQTRDAVGPGGNRVGCGAVRPNLERVLAFDLEQVCDFREHPSNCLVIHV